VLLDLAAMEDEHVFDVKSEPAKKLKGRNKPQDILQMAIGMEEDSITFYAGLKECLPAKAGKYLSGILAALAKGLDRSHRFW